MSVGMYLIPIVLKVVKKSKITASLFGGEGGVLVDARDGSLLLILLSHMAAPVLLAASLPTSS